MAIPPESTEEQIQELVQIFNNHIDSIYENCQAHHKKLFKTLPLEIDCLILKIYVSSSKSLGATAANSEQNCLLFQEAKELKLTSRTCKVGEWPYSELIDFREGIEPCKSALAVNNINEVINKCNFTKEEPPIGIILPHGGILIQGDKLTIKNGEASISQKAPLAIYSPEILTVKVEEEDYVFPPAIQIEKLIILI